jgi:hypothetical protein
MGEVLFYSSIPDTGLQHANMGSKDVIEKFAMSEEGGNNYIMVGRCVNPKMEGQLRTSGGGVKYITVYRSAGCGSRSKEPQVVDSRPSSHGYNTGGNDLVLDTLTRLFDGLFTLTQTSEVSRRVMSLQDQANSSR